MEERLSEPARLAWQLYERLRPDLEASEIGKAIAIHPGSGDYRIGSTHTEARHLLDARHTDGEIVTFTIGPPTPGDMAVGYRILAGQKR